jgi:hypothetical protein
MPNPYDGYNPDVYLGQNSSTAQNPTGGIPGYDQHALELARQAGMIPLAAGAQAAPIPGQAQGPPQKHGFDMSKLAALGQYAAAGAIPGWGGPAAIGMLALRDYLKSRKNKRAAMDEKGPGGISIPELLGSGAKAVAANPSLLGGEAQGMNAEGYAKGGLIGTRRKFTGVPSTTMRKPRPNPTPAKVKAPSTTTPKMHKMTAPAIRFATGGLVRGCGMAIKGKKCGKKC